MWISKARYDELVDRAHHERVQAGNWQADYAAVNARLVETKTQLAALTAERTWFMHRLTQVEHERGMLMQDRLGVKIAVPEFVPTTDSDDVSNALSRVVDISTIGGDAKDTDADPSQNSGIDYTNLPGYAGKRR